MDPMTPRLARQALTDHPHYPYRGCAPDLDEPARAAGNLDLTVDAWGPWMGDIPEPQRVRIARERAALAVCSHCPVLAQCRTYGNTETADGHLAEPEGILGGELALTRHRALIARRAAAAPVPADAHNTTGPGPVTEARTPQRLALLAALARDTDDELIAYRAGMDVRTARWHRSALTTLLGLDKEHATRQELLAAARSHGLLPKGIRILPDGPFPIAAAPNTDGTRQRRIAPRRPVQLRLVELADLPIPPARPANAVPPVEPAPTTAGRPRLTVVPTPRHEQLALPAPLHLAAAA
ncbi:hypothetical protein [Streptomyces xanthochromogenes]